MITVRVNGKPVELEAPMPLMDYVARLGVDPRSIAVEVNGEILQRSDYPGCTLRDGDVVEIVRMVGGGGNAAPPAVVRPVPSAPTAPPAARSRGCGSG